MFAVVEEENERERKREKEEGGDGVRKSCK